jgi:hypothetical protein
MVSVLKTNFKFGVRSLECLPYDDFEYLLDGTVWGEIHSGIAWKVRWNTPIIVNNPKI